MVSFRGHGAFALIGFIVAVVVVALGLRTVLGPMAATVQTSVVFGISLLASAAFTAFLARLGTRDGGPTRGRHEVGGLPLERVALLELGAGVIAIVIGLVA